MYLNYNEEELHKRDAYWTAREIQQQPDCWANTLAELSLQRERIEAFLAPVLSLNNLRIILTGAGTSAFVGDSAGPVIMQATGRRLESIATTDLVASPSAYFQSDVPTLLVSFARSGNSPESAAAVALADQCVTQCYHLILTCNKDGELYREGQGNNRLALVMPEETNDKGFAMTSSFSSMLLSALHLLGGDKAFERNMNGVLASVRSILASGNEYLKAVAETSFERVVFLGSGALKGIARESALKLLELCDGEVVASHDSSLGFRHGPKAIVNCRTLLVMFVSNDPYTRQYDLALLNELNNDNEAGRVLAIYAKEIPDQPDVDSFYIEQLANATDAQLLLPYIVCAQLYAFHVALRCGNKVDNPSASGSINRVVQGVSIYEYPSR